MALTAETIQKLKGKELDKFYNKNKSKLQKMVKDAEKFIKPWLPQGESVRQADLSSLVVIPLRLDNDWVTVGETVSLRGRRWASDFAEYVVDQMYPANIQ